MSIAFARPSHVGSSAISAVHCVSASTNTRSKNSSSGVTLSFSRSVAVRRGAWGRVAVTRTCSQGAIRRWMRRPARPRGLAAGVAPEPDHHEDGDEQRGEADDQHPDVALGERGEHEAGLRHAGDDAGLLLVGEREASTDRGPVGVALGAVDAVAGLRVLTDLDDPVGDEALGAGAARRLVGDHVTHLQRLGGDDLVEDERPAVVRAGHRAADDDVALPAHEGGTDEQSAKQNARRDQQRTERATDAAGNHQAIRSQEPSGSLRGVPVERRRSAVLPWTAFRRAESRSTVNL